MLLLTLHGECRRGLELIRVAPLQAGVLPFLCPHTDVSRQTQLCSAWEDTERVHSLYLNVNMYNQRIVAIVFEAKPASEKIGLQRVMNNLCWDYVCHANSDRIDR